MTVSDQLRAMTARLEQAGIATSRLDALILFEDVTGKDRAWLLAHPETVLKSAALQKLGKWVERRAKHEPLAYIRGKSEFYGREFKVNKRVLVPRPESETMIDLFKRLKLLNNALVADVGSGSGALGITAALECPNAHPIFIDIDPNTLAIANANARTHKVKGQYHQGDLLAAWAVTYDALLCNLPYVPDSHVINQAAMIEPEIAIFGGPDGLDLYRTLFEQLSSGKYGTPYVLTESLPFQHEDLAEIAKAAGYEQTKQDDFIQVFERI